MDGTIKQRFFEIDALRGIAIVLMLIYHFFFDMYFLGIHEFHMHSGLLLITGRTAAILFVFLVGVSLTLSYSRARQFPATSNKFFFHNLKRGAGIFSWGLVITLVTDIVLEKGTIYFGILHLIGLSVILAYPFLAYRIKSLIAGIIVLCADVFINNLYASYPWLLWLGIKPYGFYTLDYFPLIPWFGVVLIGVFTGNTLYHDNKRTFRICDCKESRVIKFLSFMGKKSLLIYLLHQPFIVGILLLLTHMGI